ncbi:MAG: Lrp/AsnC family transcriptional regulator [Desulfobacterales bacterium]|nr:Lrp/AsnC family transcriptional regulator [Desulfobacterales bacterium]
MNELLDNTDWQILTELQKDGRASHAAIGKKVGLTGPSVYSRIQKMEREGIIKGYSVHLNPDKVGQGLLAFVRVGTYAGTASDEQDDFEEFVMKTDQIIECHDVDGEDSYLLKIRTDTLESLRDLLAQIRGISSVSRTVSSINMVTVKETGLNAPVDSNR